MRTRILAPTLLVLGALAVVWGSAHAAAIITIVNNDGAGEGLNDPTPRSPVGGNPGMTLGEQRLFVLQHGAAIWGSILNSNVPILVRAQFNPQTCSATTATLGSTGATTIHREFAGAPFVGTWYVQSLANEISNTDLSAAQPDMNSTFNSNIDAGCFGPGLLWYYGIDGLEAPNIELLAVVLHEMGHGLGFATTTSGTTGNFNGGFPSIYDRFLLDTVTGLHWNEMSAAQRVASAVSLNRLVWDGPEGNSQAANYLGPRPQMRIDAPAGIAGDYDCQTATFGPALTLGGFTGEVVPAEDGTAPVNDGCEPIVNGGALAGKIALVDRGLCTFALKAQAVQAAGAVGMIVVNNVPAGLPGMGGTDPSITIPCIGISQADGNAIKAALVDGVTVTLRTNPALRAGMDGAGRALMYAPSPFQGGSSVSHWDVSLSPNVLMEPAINNDLHDAVDITHGLLADIGWFLQPPVPVLVDHFTAESARGGILVKWHFADLSNVGSITLERSTSAAGPWLPIRTELGQDGALVTALDRDARAGVVYYYQLHITDRSGSKLVVGMTSGRRVGDSVVISMSPPTPNPAVNETFVRFAIANQENVALTVTDVSGRVVRRLIHGPIAAGEHLSHWDAKDDRGRVVAAGVYYIRLATAAGQRTQRVAILR